MIVVRVSQDVELGREWSCHANLAAGWIKAEIYRSFLAGSSLAPKNFRCKVELS